MTLAVTQACWREHTVGGFEKKGFKARETVITYIGVYKHGREKRFSSQ
jgi:hypothetical protein